MVSVWLGAGREKENPEPKDRPLAQRQVGRPPTSPAQDDQLLLEHEILSDHRSHATGATPLRGHDSKVEQGEQEVLHARVTVGQTPGAGQRCPIRESARELAIRDPQASEWWQKTARRGTSASHGGVADSTSRMVQAITYRPTRHRDAVTM